MTDYEWALEYKKSAEVIKEKIDKLERRANKRDVLSESEYKKSQTLYEMYNDCVYSYKCLLRRCKK